MRRVGRHRLDHRVATQRELHVHAVGAGPIEYYTGTISKLGVDIGVTGGGIMVWLVFAPTNRPVGGLSGNYVGGSAEASVVAGLGANALVGGSNRSVALQPLSVSGQVGLNIAAGVAGLDLRYVR